MRAAKVQASLCIRAVSPEPSLLAHTSSELRGTFRQKARSLAPLNGWACAVKICHDGMLEDTNSLDGAQIPLAVKPDSQPDYDTRRKKRQRAYKHIIQNGLSSFPIEGGKLLKWTGEPHGRFKGKRYHSGLRPQLHVWQKGTADVFVGAGVVSLLSTKIWSYQWKASFVNLS